ncbi:putative monovalent cation/H+ antiporter subunit E [Rosistilla oblonga]|nr:putative monovalent cation/H+ antiporter subunit E [Rosistilla oblonga]
MKWLTAPLQVDLIDRYSASILPIVRECVEHTVKYLFIITLSIALFATWLLWSGHFDDPFLIALGVGSCLISVAISRRMKIVDEEGAPAHLGLRPFTSYAPWLIKEIVQSNMEVTRIILSPKMPLQRSMIRVSANQKTELGRVILANSITLTPGTVTVRVEGNSILVHALSFEGAAEDLSGEMDRRVCALEK